MFYLVVSAALFLATVGCIVYVFWLQLRMSEDYSRRERRQFGRMVLFPIGILAAILGAVTKDAWETYQSPCTSLLADADLDTIFGHRDLRMDTFVEKWQCGADVVGSGTLHTTYAQVRVQIGLSPQVLRKKLAADAESIQGKAGPIYLDATNRRAMVPRPAGDTAWVEADKAAVSPEAFRTFLLAVSE